MEASQAPQGDDAQNSQEAPTEDSGLQTPQPDQPVPTEEERHQSDDDPPTPQDEVQQSAQPVQDESASEPVGNGTTVREDPAAVQARRDAELEAARREHNERTGGGTVNEGEVQAARDHHNSRLSGDRSAGVPRPTEAELQAQSQSGSKNYLEDQNQS